MEAAVEGDAADIMRANGDLHMNEKGLNVRNRAGSHVGCAR